MLAFYYFNGVTDRLLHLGKSFVGDIQELGEFLKGCGTS